MLNLFNDSNQIALYIKIQDELNKLNQDSDDESIDKIISLIPTNCLNKKEDLKIIFSIFEYYANYHSPSMMKNCIRLFQRILTPMKTILKDESSFFWHIFNSYFYLKLFMFQEGLVSIEQIISSSNYNDSIVGEYFYPEILEQKPEIFENDTKYKLKISYDSESIQKFKELRQKHFEWLLTSGDFNDPIYTEIEQNPLRLSIKRDDVESFQKILSNSNISINSEIEESIFEIYYICPHKVSLLEYAVKFNANNIFKFLVMQNVDIKTNMIFTNAIQNNNYEMIHFFEQKIEKRFKRKLLPLAVSSFNDDIIEYALNNYNNDIFEKSEMNIRDTQILLDVINQTFISRNFKFFESTILPFLRKNILFVKQNIHNILFLSLNDSSFYFTKEILKYPEIDINHHQKFRNIKNVAPLGIAMDIGNFTAVEELLNHPDIKINEPVLNELTPLCLACKINVDIKFVKMICNHPKFNSVSALDNEIFYLCAANNNFCALEYILSKFPDLEIKKNYNFCFYLCLNYHNYTTLKIIVKLMFEKNKDLTPDDLIRSFDEDFRKEIDYNVEFVDEFRRFVYEYSK